MKKFLNKVSVLGLCFAMAMMTTACHTGDDEGSSTSKVTPTVKNTLRGTIVDQDGAALMGATIKLNGKSVVVNGNTFEATGLKNGNYVVQVTATGYKKAEETVTLSTSTKVVEGETVVVGQDVATVIYLTKDEKRTVNFGVGGDSESIVVETSKQNDGTGHIVGNTQDPNNQSLNSEIVVTATVPANNATGISATGKITISFDEKIKAVEGTAVGATLNGKAIEPTWSNRSVSFSYSGLDYDTQYTFQMPIAEGSYNPNIKTTTLP